MDYINTGKQKCNVFVIVDNPVITDMSCGWYSYH